MSEQAVLFGEINSLVGVVTDPPADKNRRPRPAVILLNSGIVHRVGPGRIYVKIARILAAAGFVVLRFDFAGIGDSAVRHDSVPFRKSAIQEVQKAMDFLYRSRDIAEFVLMGGCSGAAVSLETACHDLRVIGSVLMNFPVFEDEAEDGNPDLLDRNAAHYYWNFALFNLKSWRKFFTGRANYRQLIRALAFQVKRRFGSGREPSPEMSELRAKLKYLSDRSIPIHFIYSESDTRLDDLREAVGREFKRLCALKKTALKIIPRADHTFSSLHDHDELIGVLLKQVEIITESKTSQDEAVVPRTTDPVLPLNISDSVARLQP